MESEKQKIQKSSLFSVSVVKQDLIDPVNHVNPVKKILSRHLASFVVKKNYPIEEKLFHISGCILEVSFFKRSQCGKGKEDDKSNKISDI